MGWVGLVWPLPIRIPFQCLDCIWTLRTLQTSSVTCRSRGFVRDEETQRANGGEGTLACEGIGGAAGRFLGSKWKINITKTVKSSTKGGVGAGGGGVEF